MPLRRLNPFTVVLYGFLATAGLGCRAKTSPPLAGRGDSGPGQDSGSSGSQACSDYGQAECAKRSSCSNGANVTRDFGTLETCVARETLACAIGLAAPDTGNTPELVETCAESFAALSCDDFWVSNLPPACIPSGEKPDGAPCAFNAQCSTTYCNNAKISTCGTCGGPPAMSSSCVSSSCARGQECSITNVCFVPGTLDAGCMDNSYPCASEFSCIDGNNGSTPGFCQASLSDAGLPCGGSLGECETVLGLSCGSTGSRVCGPLNLGAQGAPCGALDGGVYGACLVGSCYTDAGVALAGQIGACKAAAADGDPCDIVFGPPCLTPSRCIISVPGATGGVCTVPSGATCG